MADQPYLGFAVGKSVLVERRLRAIPVRLPSVVREPPVRLEPPEPPMHLEVFEQEFREVLVAIFVEKVSPGRQGERVSQLPGALVPGALVPEEMPVH